MDAVGIAVAAAVLVAYLALMAVARQWMSREMTIGGKAADLSPVQGRAYFVVNDHIANGTRADSPATRRLVRAEVEWRRGQYARDDPLARWPIARRRALCNALVLGLGAYALWLVIGGNFERLAETALYLTIAVAASRMRSGDRRALDRAWKANADEEDAGSVGT